jgi:hypothetical protein
MHLGRIYDPSHCYTTEGQISLPGISLKLYETFSEQIIGRK